MTFIVSIIDNPNGLSKPVLQLLEQENRAVHYVDVSFGYDFGKAPLSFWERQIGRKLKEESKLIEPKEPDIYHWKTMEKINENIVKDFLIHVLQTFIEDAVSEKTEEEDMGSNWFPMCIIREIPKALLSLKESLQVLHSLKQIYEGGGPAYWLTFMTIDFFEKHPAFFAE